MAYKVPILGLAYASPRDVCAAIGGRAKAVRLARGTLQAELAVAAGVSRQTVLRFERGDSITFEAVLRIAYALRSEDGFDALFPPLEMRSLDELLGATRKPKRARARKKSS